MRGVRGGGRRPGGLHRQQPVFLVAVHDPGVSAALWADLLGAGHRLPRGRRPVRLDPHRLARLPLGRPGLLVLLDQLPPVDGVFGCDVSGAAGVCVRLAAGAGVVPGDPAGLYLDRHGGGLLPGVRQHRHPEPQRRHQNSAGGDGGGAGHCVCGPERLCQRYVRRDLPAVLRPGQSVVYLRHHLQLSGL